MQEALFLDKMRSSVDSDSLIQFSFASVCLYVPLTSLFFWFLLTQIQNDRQEVGDNEEGSGGRKIWDT